MYTLLLITELSLREKEITASLSSHFTIKVAPSLNQAEQLLKYLRPDIIIVDEEIPLFSCKAFCTYARSFRGYESIPIIVFSEILKKTHIRALKEDGASEVVFDPVEPSALLHFVEKKSIDPKLKGKMSSIIQTTAFPGDFHGKTLDNRTIVSKNSVEIFASRFSQNERISILLLETTQNNVEKHLEKALRPQDAIFQSERALYIIVLPNTTAAASKILAENSIEVLSEYPDHEELYIGGASLSPPLSLQPEATLQRLLSEAKHNLAKAKTEKVRILITNLSA